MRRAALARDDERRDQDYPTYRKTAEEPRRYIAFGDGATEHRRGHGPVTSIVSSSKFSSLIDPDILYRLYAGPSL